MSKINPLLSWWVTPKLPPEDIYEDHAKEKKGIEAFKIRFSQWVVHPLKRRAARLYIKLLKLKGNVKIIGVTGSAGKSTTVQMLASILRNSSKVHATPPSIDPVYNIPNTIVSCPADVDYLILELSVEYVNEMDYYLWLAQPDIGVILNIFPTHTEFFKNAKGVANEKFKLIDSLSKEDLAILNKDSKHITSLSTKSKARIVWFGKNEKYGYELKDSKRPWINEFNLKAGREKVNIRLPALGEQFIQNAVTAAACAMELGFSIKEVKKGLEKFRLPEHRMNIFRHRSGAIIFDETYNNNPAAAKEALKAFSKYAAKKQRIVVMGDMLELGSLEKRSHKELGELIAQSGATFLIGVGKAAKTMVESASIKLKPEKAIWLPDNKDVLKMLKPRLNRNSAVLIKGSRSIHLEKVVSQLS